jgi:hypothetical protein
MALAGVLSNPATDSALDQLAEVLAALEPKLATHKIVLRKLPMAQGEVLQVIRQVLAYHPDGLQAFEVRRLVETELGRKVPSSTIKNDLADNPAFERIGRGRYRLTNIGRVKD